MRARIVSVFALAVASCVAVALYRDADGQVPPLLRPPSFPPHPADIVNLDGSSTFTEVAGFDHVAFSVPNGKWLVVTDVRTRGETSSLRIVQRAGGSDTNKLSGKWTSGPNGTGERQSAIGYAFPPASSVVVKIDPVPNGSTGSSKVDWNLVGYLAN